MRGIGRFIASVLIVSGVLLLADVAITLLWQEPISALIAKRDQDRLSGQLKTLDRVAAADAHTTPPSPARSYVMVEGTDSGSLRKGPGHYPGTALPGEPGTVAVAGHRTTYLAPFKTIDQLRPGDAVVLEMPYGSFTYRVQTTRIVPPTALWVTHNVGYPRLVLSACHPLYSAAKRIVVFAKLTAPIEERSRPASTRTSATTRATDTSSTAIQ
jgi:sortase A